MRISNAATNADVAKFNFDDLEKIADGKYNKGEVLLSKDGKLVTVNNHVSLTSWNDIVSTSDQNRAVREAIAKTLKARYVRFSSGTVADFQRRNAYAAANAVAEFLTNEANQNLPLSRDELRKLLQICTPEYRSSVDQGLKQEGEFEEELGVIREFGQAKMSGDVEKLNAFVDTLNDKLGDSAAQLGTDVRSWVKGLSVENLDAETRATVLKKSDNQTISQNCEKIRAVLNGRDDLTDIRNITKEIYDTINPLVGEVSDHLEQAAAETFMPAIQSGKVPSVKDFRRFLQSACQKLENFDRENDDEKLAPYLMRVKARAFALMLTRNDMLIRSFIANPSPACKNFRIASTQLYDESFGGYARADDGEDATELARMTGLGGEILKSLNVYRGAYLLSLPKETVVNELMRMSAPDYLQQQNDQALVCVWDCIQLLQEQDTTETNAILSDYFRQLGNRVLDGTLGDFSKIDKQFVKTVLQEELRDWFVRCAQNRALNAATGTDYQPQWVVGSRDADTKLAVALILGLENKSLGEGLPIDDKGAKKIVDDTKKIASDLVKRYNFDPSRPIKVPEELKTALRENAKLRKLLGETLSPNDHQIVQHINRPPKQPGSVNGYSTLSEIAGEISKQIETFVPLDVKLSEDTRRAYVKLAVEMYLYNNPHVSKETLLNEKVAILNGLPLHILTSGIKHKIDWKICEKVKNAFLQQKEHDCIGVGEKIMAEIKAVIASDSSAGWEDKLADRVKAHMIQRLDQILEGYKPAFKENSTLIDLTVDLVRSSVDETKSSAAKDISKTQKEYTEVYAALEEIAMEEQGLKG